MKKDIVMSRICAGNAPSIGNTPLVVINRIGPKGVTILAKIAGRNPAYSVKCRIGASLVWDAEAQCAQAWHDQHRDHLWQYRYRPGARRYCPCRSP
jgi:hypothetical protein